MDNDLIMTSSENINIYQSDIEQLIDSYKLTLDNPDNINKPAGFLGLTNYIKINFFKHIIKHNHGANRSAYDYNELDSVFFNIYIPLCSRYNITPSLQGFCVLVGISYQSLYDIINNTSRANSGGITPYASEIIKKWHTTCESALYYKAVESNGIGAIFGLKVVHHWREDPQQLEILPAHIASAAEIEEKYSGSQKPELIDNLSG